MNDEQEVAYEVNFRWGANVSAQEVREVLDFGFAFNLEPREAAAIQREAQSAGVY